MCDTLTFSHMLVKQVLSLGVLFHILMPDRWHSADSGRGVGVAVGDHVREGCRGGRSKKTEEGTGAAWLLLR